MAGRCSEAELSLPYLPFVEAIGNYLTGQDTGQVAARLGPRGSGARGAVSAAVLGPEPRGGDPGQAKLRLFEAIVSLLGTTAAEGALLLVVEDVNWADASSTRSG
jgi:AAA ATPase domain